MGYLYLFCFIHPGECNLEKNVFQQNTGQKHIKPLWTLTKAFYLSVHLPMDHSSLLTPLWVVWNWQPLPCPCGSLARLCTCQTHPPEGSAGSAANKRVSSRPLASQDETGCEPRGTPSVLVCLNDKKRGNLCGMYMTRSLQGEENL